jgi:hypothetical protein
MAEKVMAKSLHFAKLLLPSNTKEVEGYTYSTPCNTLATPL